MVRGFKLAIDCDRCTAFISSETKSPDLLVLRELNDRTEWLVTEIKAQMDSKARDQIEAGLQIIASHHLFSGYEVDTMKGLLAFTRANRTADLTRLRRPLRIAGKQVPIKDHRCGNHPV